MSTKPKVLLNFINGQFVPARSQKTFINYCPATNEPIHQVADSQTEDIEDAVQAARRAFPDWSQESVSVRASFLEAIADGIEARLEEFAQAESFDQGKPVSLARRVDIPRACENFRFFARQIRQSHDQAFSMPGALSYTLRQPVGVAGLISPWNLPLYLLTWKIAPALATGNTCVAKPSEITPYTASLLAEVCTKVKLPPGVVNIVQGLGHSAGAALVAHPKVPLISFTGGTQTGAKVASSAAPQFKKLSLELGGKNPTIVFADADLEKACEGAVRAAFTNQGEICLCGSRILVQQSVYEEVLEKLTQITRTLKVGNPKLAETDLGAIVSKDHLQKILGYIQLAKDSGGTLLTGGSAPSLEAPFSQGNFLEPTLISGLSAECPVVQEEIFGPVAAVLPFQDEAEALALANGTRYGLSASLWTQDLAKAHRVARQLEAGTVWINTWMLRDLRAPFGGSKDSGVGREGGEHSIQFFTEQKTVCLVTE